MSLYYRQINSMGTRFDLVIPDLDSELGDQLSEMVRRELLRIENKLSLYNPDSVISAINRNASHNNVPIDGEMTEIFNEIFHYHVLSGGYFDITIRPVLDYISKKGGEQVAIPSDLKKLTGMQFLKLGKGWVRFEKNGMSIDLGGYGKGYAMKRVAKILDENHIENALLSFGESLVTGIGTHPYGDAWRINIPRPEQTEKESIIFDLKNETLSSSGNSLNNQKKFGNSGHIFDPIDFVMRTRLGLVSVKSDDPVRAEIFSTALFSSGIEKAKDIVKGLNDLEMHWIS